MRKSLSFGFLSSTTVNSLMIHKKNKSVMKCKYFNSEKIVKKDLVQIKNKDILFNVNSGIRKGQ